MNRIRVAAAAALISAGGAGVLVLPSTASAHHNTVSCQAPGVWLIENSEAGKSEHFTTNQGHEGDIGPGGSTTVNYSGTSLTVFGTWTPGGQTATNTGTGDCTVPTTTEPEPEKVWMCHETGNGSFVIIEVDAEGLNGHGDHEGDKGPFATEAEAEGECIDDPVETTEPPATTDPPVETTEPPTETTEPVETTEPPVETTDPPVETTDPPATTDPVETTDPPPATDPPATDPPATDPPTTDPPATDPPVVSVSPTTPAITDPPAPAPSPTPACVDDPATPDVDECAQTLPATGTNLWLIPAGIVFLCAGLVLAMAGSNRRRDIA